MSIPTEDQIPITFAQEISITPNTVADPVDGAAGVPAPVHVLVPVVDVPDAARKIHLGKRLRCKIE